MTSKPLVIITGASSGIGAAVAKVFSAEGYPVGLIARNGEAMRNLNLPNSMFAEVDVADYQQFKKAVENIEAKLGKADCLINNAGVAKSGDFIEIEHAENEKMVDVNLSGVINGTEILLPGMRERKTGTVINISSLADRTSRPHLAVYAATKAAVKSFSESLRAANAKYGVRICNIAPAKVLTPMLINANLNNSDIIQVSEIPSNLS